MVRMKKKQRLVRSPFPARRRLRVAGSAADAPLCCNAVAQRRVARPNTTALAKSSEQQGAVSTHQHALPRHAMVHWVHRRRHHCAAVLAALTARETSSSGPSPVPGKPAPHRRGKHLSRPHPSRQHRACAPGARTCRHPGSGTSLSASNGSTPTGSCHHQGEGGRSWPRRPARPLRAAVASPAARPRPSAQPRQSPVARRGAASPGWRSPW
mmetsp:Transcript_34723/g.96006  ORF Transcript_34723/g.96006 Transcript_34723/m.96006 type:complete len:211 (-) Transcript_34723:9-641(-)